MQWLYNARRGIRSEQRPGRLRAENLKGISNIVLALKATDREQTDEAVLQANVETELGQRQRALRESVYSEKTWEVQVKLLLLHLLCEAQIELTVVKILLEDIIERPPLKVGPGDVAQDYWVNSSLNLLCYVLSIMFCLLLHCLCISQSYWYIA